jgi:hypothetical protein
MAKLSQQQIAAIAARAGMSDPVTMSAIAMAESGGRTTAHNPIPPDNSYGLWQINMLGAMGPARRREYGISSNSALFDPAVNARAAKKILDSQGLRAWSTYTNGAYKKYMPSGGGVTQANDFWKDPFNFWPDEMDPHLKGPLDQWFGEEETDEFGNPLGDVSLGDIATGIGTIAEAVQKTAVWLGNSQNWVRVGYVVGGVLLAGMGLQIIAKPAVSKATPALRTASKVAKKVTK